MANPTSLFSPCAISFACRRSRTSKLAKWLRAERRLLSLECIGMPHFSAAISISRRAICRRCRFIQVVIPNPGPFPSLAHGDHYQSQSNGNDLGQLIWMRW